MELQIIIVEVGEAMDRDHLILMDIEVIKEIKGIIGIIEIIIENNLKHMWVICHLIVMRGV